MAAILDLPFALGAAPSGFKAAGPSSISNISSSTLFPAGPSYLGHVRRQLNQRSFEQDDEAEQSRLEAEIQATGGEDDDLGIGEEEESADLLERDPKEWKVSSFHLAFLQNRR